MCRAAGLEDITSTFTHLVEDERATCGKLFGKVPTGPVGDDVEFLVIRNRHIDNLGHVRKDLPCLLNALPCLWAVVDIKDHRASSGFRPFNQTPAG